MKEAIEAEFEKVKTELHEAVDKVALDAPDIAAQLAALAEKHGLVSSFISVLSRL